jgi:glycosyltransferase involved in cell wall biosynthesis
MKGSPSLLWVGRLQENKDPLTILKGLHAYREKNKEVQLYMIYQEAPMMKEVMQFINDHQLQENITLVGKIEHQQLPDWYSAADYYVSGSHREGSGYALAEAMCCGCIPLVTSIPPFFKMTAEGKFGFHFPAGNSNAFAEALIKMEAINKEEYAAALIQYSQQTLTGEAIAQQFLALASQLLSE